MNGWKMDIMMNDNTRFREVCCTIHVMDDEKHLAMAQIFSLQEFLDPDEQAELYALSQSSRVRSGV